MSVLLCRGETGVILTQGSVRTAVTLGLCHFFVPTYRERIPKRLIILGVMVYFS